MFKSKSRRRSADVPSRPAASPTQADVPLRLVDVPTGRNEGAIYPVSHVAFDVDDELAEISRSLMSALTALREADLIDGPVATTALRALGQTGCVRSEARLDQRREAALRSSAASERAALVAREEGVRELRRLCGSDDRVAELMGAAVPSGAEAR